MQRSRGDKVFITIKTICCDYNCNESHYTLLGFFFNSSDWFSLDKGMINEYCISIYKFFILFKNQFLSLL